MKGSAVNIDPIEVKRRIETGLSGSEVHVEGDGQHFEAIIVHGAFAGKSMIEQHRMVYDTLGPGMGGVHALSIKTYTPEQWERSKPR
jgi:acid stress-induced BolA-like protein IbaG/YrbA